MSEIQCDACPRNALYTVMIQDLVKERDGLPPEPVKMFCQEHTQKRVVACLAVPNRYCITIDPTGQSPRARIIKPKTTNKHSNDAAVETEVNRYS